jgi:hypothetical protein
VSGRGPRSWAGPPSPVSPRPCASPGLLTTSRPSGLLPSALLPSGLPAVPESARSGLYSLVPIPPPPLLMLSSQPAANAAARGKARARSVLFLIASFRADPGTAAGTAGIAGIAGIGSKALTRAEHRSSCPRTLGGWRRPMDFRSMAPWVGRNAARWP